MDRGQKANLVGVTSLLFFEGHPGIFNEHRVSGPRFNVSSGGQCSLSLKCPRLYTGALGPRQTTICWPIHVLTRLSPA